MERRLQVMRDQTVVPVVMRLEIHVGFHPENVCCAGCRFCVQDQFNRDRKRCMVTHEIIYQDKLVGMMCPLEPVEESKQWKAGEF